MSEFDGSEYEITAEVTLKCYVVIKAKLEGKDSESTSASDYKSSFGTNLTDLLFDAVKIENCVVDDTFIDDIVKVVG